MLNSNRTPQITAISDQQVKRGDVVAGKAPRVHLDAGLDPTAVIGGRLSAFGSNARLGRGDYMVVEADESDRSFLKLTPAIAVITNIDHEHMESYGSWDALQQAFVDFANKVPF